MSGPNLNHNTVPSSHTWLSILVVQVHGIHQFAVNVKLLMEGCPITDSHGPTAPVAIQVIKFNLWQVSLASDGEHDGQTAVFSSAVCHAIADEGHVCLGFFCETHPEQDVNCERAVANLPSIVSLPSLEVFGHLAYPREAVIPVSSTLFTC